ncbi:DNA-binding response regulator, NarL/FixJ family, contains REC and HTH domains [Lentzea fradiae]|uniref:DNA-binding response regulator, NarL/FixJ family, contains REC and HTH domains n=1 Tax=Lentzea fradiae TaxID=200378 RepID=A0A1G7L581_9PSEU|nr:response regulator transcription factor [Lentzea fradiae]SDF44200.1 DNA-binding response regulator, NarL/FixJ family, contains REC and HTH domains [Lentzea fradiae]
MTIRVVVCEDQELVRTGYVAAFGSQPDMRVVGEAADGPAAVEAVTRLRPDVVVMDIHLPLLDGIEATRRVAGPGVPDPPKVLVVTTFNIDEYVYRALRAGASGFLLKDTPLAELIQGVRTVTRGDSLLSPAVTKTLIGRFAGRIRPGETGDARPLDVLAPRELEVLRLMAGGLANAEIAERMTITVQTVKTYVSRIFAKLDLRDRVQAVVLAYRSGLMDGEV